MNWTNRFLTACYCLGLPASAIGASVGITSTVPANPVAGAPFVMHMTIPTSNSGQVVFRHFATVSGNVIHVDGCSSGLGFAVPGHYTAVVPVPAISAGTYAVEYYHRVAGDDATCARNPATYLMTFSFTVPAASDSYPPPAGPVARVARYYNEFGSFFMTAEEPEALALESGQITGWQPMYIDPNTSDNFGFLREPGQNHVPVCRFFSAAFAPKVAHFYTTSAAECDAVKRNPSWSYEGIAGYVIGTDVAGNCIGGVVPLYRAYNNGQGGAPVHFYTVSSAQYTGLTVSGAWAAEGVLGCVPIFPPT